MPHQQHRHVKKNAGLKRDGILDDLLDNIIPRASEDDVIYITVEPTFSGPIGGFITEGAGGGGNVGAPVQPTRKPSRTTTPAAKPTPKPTTKRTTTAKAKTTPKTKSTPTPNTLATSVSTPSNALASPTGLGGLAASPTPSDVAKESGGMTGGAKAGLAIGIIALFALIAGAALLFVRKRKRDRELDEVDNEKPAFGASSGPPGGPPPLTRTMTSPAPPQLSVRPITQFSPDFTGGAPGSGSGYGANLAAAGAAGFGAAAATRNLTNEKPQPPPKTPNGEHNPFNDPVNPFENPAGASSPPAPPAVANSAPAPLAARIPSPDMPDARTPSPETLGMGVAATGTAVAAGTVGAVAVRRSLNSGKPQGPPEAFANGPPPASPALSQDSASVASAAGPAGAGPTNVHRVQLDFAPSMDDELELKAGQLVRLVHEYDDGWALCVRLDRSQQGVVPRTCLSARPVKPRPRGPPGPHGPPGPRGPMGPDGRSMSMSSQMSQGPNGPPRFQPPPNGRPASPNAGYRPYPSPGRPMSPAQFPQVPRSLSPGPGGRIPQPRSMSPGPYGPGGMKKPSMPAAQRQRSYSTGAADGPANSPPVGPGGFSGSPPQASPPLQQQAAPQSPKPRSPPVSMSPIERKPVPVQPIQPAQPAQPTQQQE
ncbi:hypothetical protein FQN53_004454 [Emmonsiellopsis sp. PD_33]|nr:hypothetical protein FQN53_004454 [Emmonsiellopsis sp. PD_33]